LGEERAGFRVEAAKSEAAVFREEDRRLRIED